MPMGAGKSVRSTLIVDCFHGTSFGDGPMPTCFVIMGFGEKTDLATGRKLDLDKTYKNIIKPAISAAGYDCVRADEVLHSGVIDVPMYDVLYGADLVVADLSTSNLNAVFELGVRHALKPHSTIVIAEQDFCNPFDVSHIVIRSYRHLGSDIGFDETMRVRQELQDLAEALKVSSSVDSPVYTVLADLERPKLRAGRATEAAPAQPRTNQSETMAALLKIAFKARDDCDFDLAKSMFRQVHDQQIEPGRDGKPRQAWPCVIRDLALATYKAGEKAAEIAGPEVALTACSEAVSVLRQLGPATTTDPETLSLWSVFHAHRAELPNRPSQEKQADVEIAIDAAERAFAIKRDCHNGSNLAFFLSLRAAHSSGDDRIADRVRADRVRRKVVELASRQLRTLESEGVAPATEATASSPLATEKYWTMASLAESLVALGDPSGPPMMQAALASAPATWMGDVTVRQVDKLRKVLDAVRE